MLQIKIFFAKIHQKSFQIVDKMVEIISSTDLANQLARKKN